MSFRRLAVRAGTAADAASYRISPASQHVRAMSSAASQKLSPIAYEVKEQKGDQRDDVVFQSQYGLRSIILNRPNKLNSLNGSMIRKIVPRMIEWEKSNLANVVLIKGAGDKALCAGGDVVALATQNLESPDGWKKSADFFGLEYRLNHYIATYKKPYIALMDGVTMGGGVGLSVHAPFRIATERTVFAMPETTIGFFPDVGASFFLPRMNGAVGTYLALTSERLTGPNVFYSGIATHYIHSTSLPDLEARLAELRLNDVPDLQQRLTYISKTIEEFSTGLPYDQPIQIAGEVRQAIDRCFNKNNVDDIVTALGEERGATEEWAQKQLKSLQKRSPTAVHVALRQMRNGKKWDIAEALTKEHQIATKFMQKHDFSEGVVSLLRDKRPPQWQPESLEAIPKSENIAGPYFEFDEAANLELFSNSTFSEYPYQALGVPTEEEISQVIGSGSITAPKLVEQMVASRHGRQGIKEIVEEIISRKTVADDKGALKWVKEKAVSTSRL